MASDSNKTRYFYKEVELDNHLELDYLDTELVNMDIDTIDIFRVESPYEYRPDLISMKVYGDYHYGWLIALHNGFLDPVEEITLGKRVKIPDLTQYIKFYNRNAFSRKRNRKY